MRLWLWLLGFFSLLVLATSPKAWKVVVSVMQPQCPAMFKHFLCGQHPGVLSSINSMHALSCLACIREFGATDVSECLRGILVKFYSVFEVFVFQCSCWILRKKICRQLSGWQLLCSEGSDSRDSVHWWFPKKQSETELPSVALSGIRSQVPS